MREQEPQNDRAGSVQRFQPYPFTGPADGRRQRRRRAYGHLAYTVCRRVQTQYETLICASTRDSAPCVPHTLEERPGDGG
jgi:hypothetical protein